MAHFFSRLNKFAVVMGIGFSTFLAAGLVQQAGETLLHRELPAIGIALMIYAGWRVLPSFSKTKHGRAMMSTVGYVGTFAVIITSTVVVWGSIRP